MWHYIEGRWNAERAVEMYSGPLLKAMQKAFPTHARKAGAKWTVMEDNDPAGYKSAAAEKEKKKVGIKVKKLPCRSPDLNVLDYSLWTAITRKMRAQERNFAKNYRETKEDFLARLRRTALGLPTNVVKKAVMDMEVRVALLKKAKGGLIPKD